MTSEQITSLFTGRDYSLVLPYTGLGIGIIARVMPNPYWDDYECNRYPCMLLHLEFKLDEKDDGGPPVSLLSWNVEDIETGERIHTP